MNKKIMVDMSSTLLHHGHIRLLERASQLGEVIVGLTMDSEIMHYKGYEPELAFEYRKEILASIKYVSKVIPVPWVLNEQVLNKYQIDLLVHGNDNANLVSEDKLKILPRTPSISSTKIRHNSQNAITQINNQKLMLTPGPAIILHENLQYLKPLFGRGDDEYTKITNSVIEWIKELSGQDEIVMAQGSATFALELAAHSFVRGKVLLISTGYYSNRLKKLLPKQAVLTICNYGDIDDIDENFDWLMCAYTETSIAFKVDLQKVRKKADECTAKLYVDATGSIGLEDSHELADVMAFSSCKGLLGLTGACFIAHRSDLEQHKSDHFYFNIDTHRNSMTTGPYHAIASLYGVIQKHDIFKERARKSKKFILKKYQDVVRASNQPLLCTYLEGKVVANDNNVVLYSPRSSIKGSVVCHLGEVHHNNKLTIGKRISIENYSNT